MALFTTPYMELKQTPLCEYHQKLGAQMGPFGGWLMPIQYSGILPEHHWTRTEVSVFDICHMGEFFVHADLRKTNLNCLTTINLETMACGSCRYGSMLTEQGGVIDDLIVYRIKDDEWMFVVNAARIEIDEATLRKNASKNVRIENVSASLGKLDIQGPRSRELLCELVAGGISSLNYYTFDFFTVLGERVIVSRTGYTGELGYEIYISNKKIPELWTMLLGDARVKPAGLGARDTLRLEMGYTLYGQDIDERTTPLEAGLERFTDLSKDFIGKAALEEQSKAGVERKLVYFVTDSRRAPRHNYTILTPEGVEIGMVTSGSFSPSLSVGIGMGYVRAGYATVGTKLLIRHEAVSLNATVSRKPFYRKGTVKG